MWCDKTHIDLHFSVKAIVEKEVVRHADPVGFHGMALAIIVVPHIPLDRKIIQANSDYRIRFKTYCHHAFRLSCVKTTSYQTPVNVHNKTG